MDGDEGSGVFSMKPCSYSVDNITRSFCIPGWRNVNSNGNNNSEFPGQCYSYCIIVMKTGGKKPDIQATHTFMPISQGWHQRLLTKNGKLPSFILSARTEQRVWYQYRYRAATSP